MAFADLSCIAVNIISVFCIYFYFVYFPSRLLKIILENITTEMVKQRIACLCKAKSLATNLGNLSSPYIGIHHIGELSGLFVIKEISMPVWSDLTKMETTRKNRGEKNPLISFFMLFYKKIFVKFMIRSIRCPITLVPITQSCRQLNFSYS